MEGSDARGGLPENLASLIEHVGFLETDDERYQAVLSLAEDGKCMTCQAPLGTNSVVVIKADGVHMLFCGGACLTDMQVVHWLEEVHDDIVDQVKFRGGAGDVPEE